MVIFLILQFPQGVLKLVSVAVVLPLANFLKQTVAVMRGATEGETVVMTYSKHAHEVRIDNAILCTDPCDYCKT